LGFLNRAGPLWQTQIADLLALHKVPVGTALNELERDGWITRTPLPEDRRAREVTLTARSAPVIATMKVEFEVIEAELMARLDSKACQTLTFALRTIRDALHDESLENIEVKGETAVWLLIDCARHLMRRLDARLEELGFTRSQWFVLNSLHHQGGQTQMELARQLGMSPVLIGKQVDKLEGAGWIERHEDLCDRRVKRLEITSQQRDTVASIRRRFDRSHATLLDVLDTATQKELASCLESFRAYLKGQQA
jgi:DNA-binding MarR family transcriptional regulator